MKARSTYKLKHNYNIDEVIENNRCLVTFFDLKSETVEKHTGEFQKEESVTYVYDAYRLKLMNNEEYIKENVDALLELAKQSEYVVLAHEVRSKRDKLLEETDKYAMTDRVLSEEMKQYRQDLRDIPEQKGFPYSVVFPIKPKDIK